MFVKLGDCWLQQDGGKPRSRNRCNRRQTEKFARYWNLISSLLYVYIYTHIYTRIYVSSYSNILCGFPWEMRECMSARKKFERTVGPRWRRIRKEKLSFLRTIMQRSNGKTKNASAYMLKYNNSEVPSSIKCQWEVSKILEYQGFMPQESKKVCRNLGI